MISVKAPFYGAVATSLLLCKFKQKEKFYVQDNLFNCYEISELDYNKTQLPIKKEVKNEID